MLRKFIEPRILLICFFIMLAGLSAGAFFAAAIENSDKLYLAEVLINHLTNENISGTVNAQTSAVPAVTSILANSFSLLLIGFAGLSVYGFPFALVILLFRSFASGFCGSLLAGSISTIGTLKFITAFLVPNTMLCLCFLTAAAVSTCYAVPRLHRGFSAPSSSHHAAEKAAFFLWFGILAVSTAVISLIM